MPCARMGTTTEIPYERRPRSAEYAAVATAYRTRVGQRDHAAEDHKLNPGAMRRSRRQRAALPQRVSFAGSENGMVLGQRSRPMSRKGWPAASRMARLGSFRAISQRGIPLRLAGMARPPRHHTDAGRGNMLAVRARSAIRSGFSTSCSGTTTAASARTAGPNGSTPSA
jgi:hypothetical protein